MMGEKRREVLTTQNTSFSGKCPHCLGCHIRIRIEVVHYGPEADSTPDGQQSIVSRTRIFLCNSCEYVWSETIPG